MRTLARVAAGGVAAFGLAAILYVGFLGVVVLAYGSEDHGSVREAAFVAVAVAVIVVWALSVLVWWLLRFAFTERVDRPGLAFLLPATGVVTAAALLWLLS